MISVKLFSGLQKAKVFKKVALTSGDWEVLARSVWVDEEHDLVFFLGMRESPLEKHLYAVSLLRPGEIKLLTRPGYSYSIDMNKVRQYLQLTTKRSKIKKKTIPQECSLVVAVYSNIRQLPACQVFRVTLSDWTVEGVNLSPVGYLLEPSCTPAKLTSNKKLTHTNQFQTLTATAQKY